MEKLYSIQTSDRFFDTSGRPVLITCNDMYDYVCKYNYGNGSALRLACEFISASFLKIWRLNVPDFALVSVSREHIPSEFKISSYYFDTTCFGSKYSRSFIDLNNFADSIPSNLRKFYSKREDLYYISLFDIWLANEDRNYNNYNLLIDIKSERNFIPIDHEGILNTRIISMPIYDISYEESLISTPLMQSIFSMADFTNAFREELCDNFHTSVKLCEDSLSTILNQLPDDWNINKKQLETKLLSEIFVDSWLSNSFKLLLSFLQRNSNK
jgi:hypothetical protein